MVTELRQSEEILADLKESRKFWGARVRKFQRDFKTNPLTALEWSGGDVIDAALLLEITEPFEKKPPKDFDVIALDRFLMGRIRVLSSYPERSSNLMTNLLERARLKALVTFLRMLEKQS